ncbi:hypothetical protein [Dyella sp.]
MPADICETIPPSAACNGMDEAIHDITTSISHATALKARSARER